LRRIPPQDGRKSGGAPTRCWTNREERHRAVVTEARHNEKALQNAYKFIKGSRIKEKRGLFQISKFKTETGRKLAGFSRAQEGAPRQKRERGWEPAMLLPKKMKRVSRQKAEKFRRRKMRRCPLRKKRPTKLKGLDERREWEGKRSFFSESYLSWQEPCEGVGFGVEP